MKKRIYVLGGTAIIVIAFLIVWVLERATAAHSRRVHGILEPSNPASLSGTLEKDDLPRQQPGGPAELRDPRWEERRRVVKLDPAYEWKLPINFYGRVLDEADHPVADASVWFQWSDLSPNGASEVSTTSDADGFFFLVDKYGNGLSLRVTKEGYYTPEVGNRFRFENARFWDVNYHEPDFDNPVLFHLRKKGDAEPLVVGIARPRVSRDGTPLRLDLLKGGVVSPSGQIVVAAWLYDGKYAPARFDWRAKVSIPDGGFREHQDEFPFIAPEVGYETEIQWDMLAGAPGWQRILTKNYYFRFGSPPKYGRMEIRINGSSPVVDVNYWLNPSGSRNLEFDPKKQVTIK
jgi:hypothetical protein